jgi:hypothetical protein
MTGPQHYQAAESLLREAGLEPAGSDVEAFAVAAAQVHATLALVAATVDAAARRASPVALGNAWEDALS